MTGVGHGMTRLSAHYQRGDGGGDSVSDGSKSTSEHRTVSRVMCILESVIASEPDGMRLIDLSETLDAPKSSIHGLARGLVATGYLREHGGRYFTGVSMAMLSVKSSQFPAAYRHALEQLSSDWGETAILATMSGEFVVNLDVVEPDQMIRASPPIGQRRPMWPGTYGKVFLAFMDARRRDSYLRRHTPDAAERARVDEELQAVRRTRVAFNRGETVPELYGVASPLILEGTDVTLAIGLAGPESRMRSRLDDIAVSVLATAARLSSPTLAAGGSES